MVPTDSIMDEIMVVGAYAYHFWMAAYRWMGGINAEGK
jgi:hypothetical protein